MELGSSPKEIFTVEVYANGGICWRRCGSSLPFRIKYATGEEIMFDSLGQPKEIQTQTDLYWKEKNGNWQQRERKN